MSQTQREYRPFTKQYLPGYTGFMPTKNDHFGMTTGEINRNIVESGGKTVYTTTVEVHSNKDYMVRERPHLNKPNRDVVWQLEQVLKELDSWSYS